MDSIRSILGLHANQTPSLKKAEASLVVELANSVLAQFLGAEVKRFARAVYIKNGALTIACLSSKVAQEIKLNEKRFIESVNAKARKKIVLNLRYLA